MLTFPILTAWFVWAAFFCLGLCSAAAQPIPSCLVPDRKERTTLLGAGTLLCLLPVAILIAGCASRNYPGPVHGPTFDGTVQSVDLPNHRLTIAPLKPGQPVTFAYEGSTKFWKNGVPIHPDEVESGKSVRVHYHTASAHHVYVQVPYAPQH